MQSDAELNLNEIIRLVIRNKKLFFGISFFIILLSFIRAYTAKKVWEGQFQIVLSQDKSSSNANSLASLLESRTSNKDSKAISGAGAGLLGLTNGSSNLKTEVEILKSPLILMSVYNKINSNSESKLFTFEKWLDKHISVNLKKGTSVLSFKYRGKKKDEILPILKKVSNEYQKYSKRDRNKKINSTIIYLKNQIPIYEDKVISASEELSKFAVINNLNQDLEKITIAKANEIKEIEETIELLNINENEITEEDKGILLFLARKLFLENASRDKISILENINKSEVKLVRLKNLYRENDRSLEIEIKNRELLYKVLQNSVFNTLKGMKIAAKAKLNASQREKEVMVKFNRLLNQVSRNKTALFNLEKNLTLYELEQAKFNEPWELITDPTLSPFPVAPSKKQIVVTGSFIGLLFSLILIKIKDRKYIYQENLISKLLKIPIILKFKKVESKYWEEKIALFSENSDIPIDCKNIALIPIGFIEDEFLKRISSLLKKYLKIRDIKITSNLIEANSCQSQLIISSLGKTSYEEINNFQERISLQKNKPIGIIILDSISEKNNFFKF